jgi:hypothetical protein
MLVTVVYQNNKMGLVVDSQLDQLISSNRIKRFLRSEGWVMVTGDPIRKKKVDHYNGPEKRQRARR